MKKIRRVVLFLFVILFLNGCTPNVQTNYTIDTNVYFRITFNGQTKTTYGLNSNYNIPTSFETFCGAYISSVGSTSSSIVFSVNGRSINDLLRQANITQNLAQIVVGDIKSRWWWRSESY